MNYYYYQPQQMMQMIPIQYAAPKGTDNFRTSIIYLVDTLEREPKQNYTITQLCNRFGFQRRRFYDVVNVLESAGCCQKTNVDCFTWLGLKNVKNHLQNLNDEVNQKFAGADLNEIFYTGDSVTISNLTLQFLLSFIAFNRPNLDIKQISNFLSRNNNRFKTTLCKLYQISHILEVVGIISKTMVPGEVLLKEGFFPQIKVKESHDQLDLGSLLSRPVENLGSHIFSERWSVFNKVQELNFTRAPILMYPSLVTV
ncbi:hypothetical protein TVAG_362740 [Trichomonas vaginalis G3]|uniref:E2F/DP family winged-helix DNA-binding domain-containing protein n=1 Tax=Trichomonas vaginalis (strain ATCC PRA-98 / G3) TaxID=412133 RepID=A2E652_TRIV3|nr:transcription factor, enhancer of yellow 2 family [Trichomonas vaginalis G3]EAY11894.1 hypothetical protein TVAG_362740 [Trichomonas vaginalis G3]KAI5532310.1 transcription factor, enhancer of yellow 2 family [Trichomonas vaginalis G3]|eukprot:XP_001324117.1 hypothetical protein [Trichomonas vaginalis G3]